MLTLPAVGIVGKRRLEERQREVAKGREGEQGGRREGDGVSR